MIEHFKPTYIDEEREKEKENGQAPPPPPPPLAQQQQQAGNERAPNSAVTSSPLNSVGNEGPAKGGGMLGEDHLSSNGFLGNGGTGVTREVRGWESRGFCGGGGGLLCCMYKARLFVYYCGVYFLLFMYDMCTRIIRLFSCFRCLFFALRVSSLSFLTFVLSLSLFLI